MLGRKKKSKKKKGVAKEKKKTDSSKLVVSEACYDRFIENYFPDPVHSYFYSQAEWNDFMYDGYDLHDGNDIIELIGDYAEGEEYFDIYQICAFDAKNDKIHYKSSIVKALLCLILQLPSIIFIIYGEMSGSDKTWCNNFNEDGKDFNIIVSKCLAFAYSLYVSFYIEDYIQNKQRGMRCIFLTDLKNKPDFLNGNWLRIGGYYNDFASYCATVASYIIIFLSESQIDLVLNALALFFLIEVDDLLVTQFDYHKIFNFIQDEPIRNKIGFRVIDSDHKQNGVRVVNSKIRAIIDGDIIDSINGKHISNKKEFDEYMRNAKYTEEITFHVNEPNDIGNVTVFEPVKNKIGFTVIDSEYNQGVCVANSKIKEIQDGNIIDKINGEQIVSKEKFDEYIERHIEHIEKITFHISSKEIGDVTVDVKGNQIKIGNDESNPEQKCTATDVWSFIYKFVDLPVRFAILIFKYVAPFYVGICS